MPKNYTTLRSQHNNHVQMAYDYQQVEHIIMQLRASLDVIELLLDEGNEQAENCFVVIETKFSHELVPSACENKLTLLGTSIAVLGVAVSK